uniref:Uncharacterized protein n=1 Tax=Scleropages formosus TaxID=113540 RepID=A0A8C9VNU6_SCLFO
MCIFIQGAKSGVVVIRVPFPFVFSILTCVYGSLFCSGTFSLRFFLPTSRLYMIKLLRSCKINLRAFLISCFSSYVIQGRSSSLECVCFLSAGI